MPAAASRGSPVTWLYAAAMCCDSSSACSRPRRPLAAGDRRVRLLERGVLAAAVQVALELGDMALLAVVAAHLVEDLDEHGEQRVDLRLADQDGLLVDVEEDALGGDADRPPDLGCEDLVVPALGQEQVEAALAVNGAVLQQERQHLQQVRLARAEEAGDPGAVCALVVVVRLQEVAQPPFDLAGDDELLDLRLQTGLIVGLDDAFDVPVDGLGEDSG